MRFQRRLRLGPGQRGALFYLGYWGIIGVYMPFMNVHFLRIGFSGREIGIISSLVPACTLVVAPILSALADQRNWRVIVLTWSLFGIALTLMLLALPSTFAPVALLMAGFACARCSVAPIGDSLVIRMAVRHGLSYGKLRLWGSLSFAIIAIACGALWQEIGFTFMFVAAGALFMPVALVASLLEEVPTPRRRQREPIGALWQDIGLVTVLGASFLIGGALSMSVTFDGVYMARLGGTDLLVGMIFGVSAFSEMPSMFFGDAIVRRLGSTATLLLAYGLLAFAFVGYALATAPWMLLVLTALKGMGFGLYFISTVRLLDSRVSAGQAATIQGIMNATAGGLAPLLAGPVSGTIYDSFGPAAVFAACAVLVIGGALILGLGAARGLSRTAVNGAAEER